MIPTLFLASFDPTIDWRFLVELASLIVMLIFALRPQPPLYKQYADKEDTEKQLRASWEVINGLRKAVGHIEKTVAEIKMLREANGERLDDVSRELLELIKQVSRLNERTERYHEEDHGRS